MATEYVVLRFQKVVGEAMIHGGAWVVIGRADVRSASSAIREVVDAQDEPPAEDQYVAIPARSWKPVTVKIETKTALKFS